MAFELLLTHGPPTAWLRSGFKANPKLRPDQIAEAIRQAKSRLVGSLHLLIQVLTVFCIPASYWLKWMILEGPALLMQHIMQFDDSSM